MVAPGGVRKGQWSAGEHLRRRPAPLYTDPRGMCIPSFVMDQPPLLALADVLADTGELDELARRLPSVRARVSEPALPLVLAALHRRLGRSLICLLPDDEDARDAAEAASWFLGGDPVAFMPGRGVAVDSGLRPPPHLVGERLRALSVLENGGLVCISAVAAAEGLAPEGERAVPVEIAVGQANGLEELAEALVVAGYERVERAEERGQIAVRGGILDVFGTTGREPIRVELFGDVVEGIRAFSPFTQRALRELESTVVFPASERRTDLTDDAAPDAGETGALARQADLVWRPSGVREVWREELGVDLDVRERSSTRFPAARSWRSRRSALRSRPGAWPRPSGSSTRSCGRAFASSSRSPTVAMPCAPNACCGARTRSYWSRESHCRPTGRSSSPLRQPAEGLSGATWPSPSCRRRRCYAGGRRARPEWRGHCDRSPISARATTSYTRTTASANCSASRPRPSAASRATTCCSRSAGRTGCTCRTTRWARCRATWRGWARPHVVEARRTRVAARQDPCRPCRARAGGRAARPVRTARARLRRIVRPLERLARTARGFVPIPRDAGPARGDRGGEGGSRVAAAHGQARVRRRRIRQDGDRRACGVRGRAQREADTRARADHGPCPAALEHVSRALRRLPDRVQNGVAVPQPCRREARARRIRRGQGGRSHRHPPRPLARRRAVESRPRRRRRGAALRGRAEGNLRQLRLEVDVLSLSATPIPARCTCRSRAFATSR